MPSPGERVAVSDSMNRDLNRVSLWCYLSEMKLNASKTKTMIVSRSRTVHLQLTTLTLDGTVLKESADLVILGVTFDDKMTSGRNLRSISSAAAQRLGIMRKSWKVFHDRSLLLRSFWSIVLPPFEYCSALWCSAADSHLKLLDRVVRSAGFLAGGVLECNFAYRRSVEELCMLFKIKSNQMHHLSSALPLPYVPVRVTRGALFSHRHSLAPPRCRTSLYRRTFVPFSVSLWNDLSDLVFDGVELAGFKSRANAFLLA